MTHTIETLPQISYFTNVSFYLKSEFMGSINRIDAKTLTVEIKPYAQYEKGIFITWKAKGQRRERRTIVAGYKMLFVLLNTKDAISPDGMFDPATKTTDANGTTTQHGRYISFDPNWTSDFVSQLGVSGVTPLVLVNESGKERL